MNNQNENNEPTSNTGADEAKSSERKTADTRAPQKEDAPADARTDGKTPPEGTVSQSPYQGRR